MPVDATGTSPGLAPTQPEEKVVNIKCRNPNCDSITAVEMQIPNQQGQRLYRCTKCNAVLGVNVGGAFNF